MPKYKYSALALDGSSVTGVVEGATPTGAGLLLLDRDLGTDHFLQGIDGLAVRSDAGGERKRRAPQEGRSG